MCTSFVFAYCIPSGFVESRQNDHILSLPRWWLFCPSSLALRLCLRRRSLGNISVWGGEIDWWEEEEEEENVWLARRPNSVPSYVASGNTLLLTKKDILAGKINTFYLIWFPSYCFVLQGVSPHDQVVGFHPPSRNRVFTKACPPNTPIAWRENHPPFSPLFLPSLLFPNSQPVTQPYPWRRRRPNVQRFGYVTSGRRRRRPFSPLFLSSFPHTFDNSVALLSVRLANEGGKGVPIWCRKNRLVSHKKAG